MNGLLNTPANSMRRLSNFAFGQSPLDSGNDRAVGLLSCAGAASAGVSSRIVPASAFALAARVVRIISTVVFLFSLIAARPAEAQTVTASIEWNANPASESVSEYKIYFNQGSGFYLLATIAATAAPNYQISGLSTGLTYQVYVTAINISGESVPSDTLSIVIPAPTPPRPSKPVNLRATIVGGSR